MNKRMIENERKRQQTLQKRKLRRQKRVIRNCILVGGFLIGIFSIKGIFNMVTKDTGHQAIASNENQSVITSVNGETQNEKINDIGIIEEVVGYEALSVGNLILVNDTYPIRDYSDKDMVSIGDYLKGVCKVRSTEIKLQKEVVEALVEMIEAFNKEVGKNDLIVTSGYRDFNTQEALHYENLLKGQTQDENLVARPDRSEHHTGLAVDFGLCYDNGLSGEYDGKDIYSWLNENCYKYGFIVRYDARKKDITGISDEPWHFRYVGREHAQIIKELGLCLEEYIELLKTYEYYTHPGQGITAQTKDCSIYYVANQGDMTHIPVPEGKDYTISGNNKDGFIITVDLQN